MPHRFSNEKCFIISPIGDLKIPTDAMRAHVEWVRTQLINPALALANDDLGTKLRAVRADMDVSARNILGGVLEAILSDQLLFVVLTHDVRPNVYYELGIAHSAARPVIILQERGMKRQFDFYHHNTLEHDFDVDGSVEPPVDHLRKTIVETYRKGEPELAFERYNGPLNKQNANLTLFDRFSQIAYADWSHLLDRAEQSIEFIGTTLLDLTKIDNDGFLVSDGEATRNVSLLDFMASKILFSGIDVTVTITHEDNPSLETMLKASKDGVDQRFTEQVRQEIEWSTRRWTDFAKALEAFDARTISSFDLGRLSTRKDLPPERRGSFKLVKILRGQIKFRMSITDREILATPILYRHGRNGSGPAFKIRSGEPLYISLRAEVDHLKETNEDQLVHYTNFESRQQSEG